MRFQKMTRTLLLALCLATPSMVYGEVVADSVADWSADGTQGADGWTYGFYDGTNDGNGAYDVADFQAFAGPDWNWTGSAWDFGGGNVPWTTVNQEGGHPNGDNNDVIHYAVRRWESDVAGPVDVTVNLAAQNVNGGGGTTALLFHNGMEVLSSTVGGTDGVGTVSMASFSVAPGDTLDLALSPENVDGTFGDGSDGSFYGMQVNLVPEPSSIVLALSGLLLLPRRRRR